MRSRLFLFLILTMHLFALAQNDAVNNSEYFQNGNNTSISSTDRGKMIQGGILFTKSVYGLDETTNKLSISGIEAPENPNITKKVFNFFVEKAGHYFLGAHVLGTIVSANGDGSYIFQEIKVYVNSQYVGNLEIRNSEWDFSKINSNNSIGLKHGLNSVSFESTAPFYPEVDALSITETISDFESFALAEKLKMGDPLGSSSKVVTEISTKSAFEPGTGWTGFPYVVETPSANHPNKVVVPVVFTYYRKLNLIAGNYSLHTGPISGDDWDTVDPVMYLFKADDPYNYSFYDDNSEQGFHARINNVRLAAGDYYLVIRCKSTVAAHSYSGKEGNINVYMDNVAMNTNMPCSGYLVDVTSPNQGVLNYFTAYSTGIPKVFIIEKATNKMRFHGGTFWYKSPMDFNWFDDARIQLTKNNSTQYQMLVCAEGAMGFYFGNCDVYGAVPSVTDNRYSSAFPNLKNNDAMFSAPSSTAYNAPSWAGGIVNKWYWIGGGGSPFVWSTWDNYFNNYPTARYAGAESFSPSYNGTRTVVAYSSNGAESGITSFAVTQNANNHTHGYAWESKLGSAERIFHPLASLSGGIFGNPYKSYYNQNNPYYYSDNGALVEKSMTLERSVELGMTVIEDIKLDQGQLAFVRSYILNAKNGKANLDELFLRWRKKIQSAEYKYNNNPYKFFDNDEGVSLIKYAKANLKESVVFFADRLFDTSDETLEKGLSSLLFCEIAKENYGEKLETIKKEWQINSYDGNGAYIAPLPDTFTKKYIKKIIDDEYLSRVQEGFEIQEDNDKIFSVYPNPINSSSVISFVLSDDASVSLSIYNQYNSTCNIIKDLKLSPGQYEYPINSGVVGKGLNVCVLEVNGQKYSRKVLKY